MCVKCNSSSTDNNNVNNNQQEELGTIEFKPVNKLMTTSATTQPTPSPPQSTNLRGNKIYISSLYKEYGQF